MLTITDLPCEVIATIFREFDNIRYLVPLILTCRHFYSSFKENPSLKDEVLKRQITPKLMPYAIALRDVSYEGESPHTGASMKAILDQLYQEPANLEARLHQITLPEALQIGRTHDIIHELAISFATRAWSLLSEEQLTLSPSEYFRFCRAFYRYELLSAIVRAAGSIMSDKDEDLVGHPLILSRQPPWEREQMGCVYDFVEDSISEATYEAVAHDVEFGEHSFDYYFDDGDNLWKQHWLAQGVRFVHSILNENSYERKLALLKAAYRSDHLTIHNELIPETDTDIDMELEGIPIEQYDRKDLEALFALQETSDMDTGPYEAWRRVHESIDQAGFAMLAWDAGSRERAYVLWDSKRLQEYDLITLFSTYPEKSIPDYRDNDSEAMQRSWKERSEIWVKGGSGYWSEGDLSKIVWSGEPRQPI